jgi:hypothetical protein
MPKLTTTPNTRLLMSASNHTGPTLESVLLDLIHDLTAKTECINIDLININNSISDEDEEGLELRNCLISASCNNAEIVRSLRECLHMQLDTVQTFRLTDERISFLQKERNSNISRG